MVAGSDFNSALLREATTASANSSAATPSTTAKSKNEISKNEFLSLLVTQLKYQDPLEPMKNEEFAVNLAQFSQLEQLVDINGKLSDPAADLSSMAAYLGNNVILNSDVVEVSNNDGGAISFDLARDALDVKVELLRENGAVAETIEVGPLAKGKQNINLSELETANGAFKVRVVANSPASGQFEPSAKISGVVSGFIPGAEPKLIIGNKQYDPADVVEVTVAK